MIDLNPNHLKTVKLILAEHVLGCEVRAFGSRVNWTAKDHSDLDLAIVGDSPTRPEVLGNLKEAFEESNLPIRVDVLDWHRISDTFKKIIEDSYERIMEPQRVPLLSDGDGTRQWDSLPDVPTRKTTNEETPPITTLGKWHKLKIGESTESWNEVLLGDCATLVRNSVDPSRIPNSPYIGLEHIGKGTLALISQGYAKDISSTKLRYSKGDILFGKLRPYFRKVVRAPSEGICSTDIWVVRALEGVHQKFLFYCMASSPFADFVTASSEGTRMPRAKWERASQYKLSIPLLPEQRAIAHILGTLNDKIELNRRMCETLEETAKVLFKSWFVDFDPVRAKAEGREPQLPAHIADLFPDRLVNSQLGLIPDGWNIKQLKDIAEHLRDTADPRDSPQALFSHFSIPAYDSSQMPVHEYGSCIKSQKTVVQPGVILISRLNPETERVWLTDVKHKEQAICSTEFSVLNPMPPFTSSYIYCLARSTTFRRSLVSVVTGTSKSHQRAPVKAVLTMRVLKPPKHIVAAFDSHVKPILYSILTTRRESTSLANIRNTLLPKLISGELRVDLP